MAKKQRKTSTQKASVRKTVRRSPTPKKSVRKVAPVKRKPVKNPKKAVKRIVKGSGRQRPSTSRKSSKRPVKRSTRPIKRKPAYKRTTKRYRPSKTSRKYNKKAPKTTKKGKRPIRSKKRVKKVQKVLPAYVRALDIARKYGSKKKQKEIKQRYLRERRKLIVRETVDIDLEAPVSSIDVVTANRDQFLSEEARLIAEQYRLKNLLESLKLKKNKEIVRAQMRRVARAINNLRKGLGTYEKPEGYTEEQYTIGKDIQVDNVYKWEGKAFIDELIDGGLFDTFVIGGISHKKWDVVSIMSDMDDLETDADMHDIYYFKITQDFETKTVTVELNY